MLETIVRWRSRPAAIVMAMFAAIVALFPSLLQAGISGENVIVVVNAKSSDSRTIANHYVELRKIPSSNVVLLDDVPAGVKVSLEDFKAKILLPTLDAINTRGLAAQVRVVAYSSGFPTAVDVSSHTARLTDETMKKYQLPVASLTGLTFFYSFILADSPDYLTWFPNLYARGKFERSFLNPFAGEKASRYDQAKRAREEEKFGESAKLWSELFDEFPSLSGVGIQAAESFALAEDREGAGRMIFRSVLGGWTSRKYLEESETLRPALALPQVAAVLPRIQDLPTMMQYPVGFASTRGWTLSGDPVARSAGGMPYMLACSLAVVGENASTLEQAIAVLERSAPSDRSFPVADVRFSMTDDVRTKTRFPALADALVWLANRGIKTEVVREPVPTTPGDCVGVMLGTATMNLEALKFRFVPGAIADNLTSLGAAFETSSQTKLTALLHAGAAMSSGAVAEPYSIQPKFPLPILYPYYTEGTTAIEAFYLATTSPYQLLIVGDPMAQPYARASSDFVTIAMDEAAGDKATEAGQLRIERRGLSGLDPKKFQPTDAMELYLNGRFVAQFRPQSTVQVRLPRELPMGACDVRVVLVSGGVLETRFAFDEMVERSARNVKISAEPESGGKFNVVVACEGAERLELFHHGERLGAADGEKLAVTISRQELGDGPLRLDAVAIHSGETVRGESLVLTDR